ncbi:hypothetical protein MTAT_12180 [Moorella thermoacetica]|uniref:Methylcobalamin:coenzyme M methyltransferase n=1 Tax=Neomoorella thermoacetica TaxID=1525 RepID=A0AAC9HHB7_NEOTH|nr:uroporphyrinogen decarboxylase family protein [Moorella thermoacetica]AOQ23636.1 methylcobalamin:coenzyme M methyltransferase [Moorella thermoacetica]TYL13820.1 hypothetical protein MTAT_12180 [Moorella thermoacetica]
MNSKERVKVSLAFEEPDRVPISATYVPEIAQRLREVVGEQELDLGVAMGNDMILTGHGFSMSYYYKDTDVYYCEWGVKWQRFNNNYGSYWEIVEHPLAGDDSKLNSYKIPDPYDDQRYNPSRKIIETYGHDYWIVGSIPCTIFEVAWALRGLDTLMMDMVLNKDYAHALMDKVMEFPLVAGKKLIELGVDMLWTGDDVGMQTGMMISPELWREFLKPRYAKLYSEFKQLNPNIKIAYHSDGNCEAILDEMYEIGLDVINPIQPKAMNPSYIKRRYGKKLAMWGTLDIQEILPFGSTADVRTEVKRLIDECAPGGGFILAPAHNIQADTPVENILAFYQAAREFGEYKKS